MKDISKLKNYRLKYKRYYGIEFGSEYAIHHIDFNHENNDIDNLILLPKELHHKYHFLVNSLRSGDSKVSISYKIDLANGNTYGYDLMKQLCEVMVEIQKWKLYKLQLEMSRRSKEWL